MPELYALDVSCFEDGCLFSKAYNLVSDERKNKIDRLRFAEDKRLSLGAGLLLKYALYKENITDYTVASNENGKPYIENKNVHFNLSHSKKWAVCVIAPFEVGCDIEKTAVADYKIAKRFFCENEYKNIVSCADGNDLFYRYWTLKESFIKAVGQGMKIPLNSFSISIGNSVTVKQSISPFDYSFFEVDALKGYRLAVCAKENLSDISFVAVTADQIFSEMTL